MTLTRRVSCSDEFCGDAPEVLVVEIDAVLARWIREKSAEVRRLKAFAIEFFDYSPTWYKWDWEREVIGEGFTSLDCMVLKITDDNFWWEAILASSDVRVSCESIAISELPE